MTQRRRLEWMFLATFVFGDILLDDKKPWWGNFLIILAFLVTLQRLLRDLVPAEPTPTREDDQR